MATYVHALEGRLRVRFPEIRGDHRAAATLRQELRALNGVIHVEANPVTGSVLVEYDDEQLSAETLFETLDLDLEASRDNPSHGALLKNESSEPRPEVRDVVAKKLVEFAAERLLLAVLA